MQSKIYVARKLMIVPGDFRKERDNLLKLNSSLSDHDHIIKYLAIIIVGEPNEAKEFNILMPLATMNLKVFLEQDPSSAPSFEIKDLLLQAAKIAHAIQWLHGGLYIKDRIFICCHMDLTLVNFLVFLDGANKDEPVGKWKIADFGISTLQELETEQRSTLKRQSDSLTVESPAHTLALLTARTARMDAARPAGPFQAPEVSRGSNVGRASDIWSYGCILFQILARGVGPGTETLRKLDLLRRFEKDGKTDHPTDYFYRERGAEKYLNPHVKDWLDKSLQNGSYPERHFVQSCKKLISNMLQIDHTRRPKAYQVNSTLWKIIRGAEEIQSPVLQPPSAASLPPGPTVGQAVRPLPQISVTPAPPDPPREESSNSPHDTDWRLTSATINGLNDFHWDLPSQNIEDPLRPSLSPPQQSASDQPTQFQTSNQIQPCATDPVFTNAEGRDNQTSPQLSATRTHSVAESIASFVSVESVNSDPTPFASVSNVIQSLISATGNMAFVTKKAIYVRGIRFDSRFYTIRTDNFEWERGSMAGDYVTAVGYIKEKGSISRTRRVSLVLTFYRSGF
jgi:serine/threonine protein kinase